MKTKKLTAFLTSAVITASLIPTAAGTAADNAALRGNANLDSKVSITDAGFIAKKIAQHKKSDLPSCSDYNMDDKISISDAAALAMDIARRNIKTYNSASIIPGIKNGMTPEEVFSVVGNDYLYKFTGSIANPGEITYYYSLDSVSEFDIDMKSEMFFEFSSKGKLCCYGYHIGRVSKTDYTDTVYPYSKAQLLEAYDKIFDVLKFRYGKEIKDTISYQGVLNKYTWEYTDFGEVWFVVGMDLWMENSGQNEIILSSSDDSLR